jgi:hypothetical protein
LLVVRSLAVVRVGASRLMGFWRTAVVQ